MSDAIYYIFLIVAAALATASLIIMLARIFDYPFLQPVPEETLAPYKLEKPKASPGDTVRVMHAGLEIWGMIHRIDGAVYSVIVSNIGTPPDEYPAELLPNYGETIHILDPHITFVFRAPVTA